MTKKRFTLRIERNNSSVAIGKKKSTKKQRMKRKTSMVKSCMIKDKKASSNL